MDLRLPAGIITDREVNNTDGNQINESKLCHVYKRTENFDLQRTATPTAQDIILFQADKSGKLGDTLSASLDDTGTATDVTFDVKKNGTTVLTGMIHVLHTDADRVQKTGTFASAAAQAYAPGDTISAVVVVSGGTTGAKGPALNYQRVEVGD